MRSFIMRARAASTSSQRFRNQRGTDAHIEIIAHAIMNAFYISGSLRDDVEFFLTLDSTADYPRTMRFSSAEGASFPSFHEEGILSVVQSVLEHSEKRLQKDELLELSPGVSVVATGFERTVANLLEERPVYFLNLKGEPAGAVDFGEHAVFVLSDHIPLPAKVSKSFVRRGARQLSFGKTMLFASQCIVLAHHYVDQCEARGARQSAD